jgi:hypothetical protein
MNETFREALAPLAARMPRIVREHEVLRVAGTLPGDDPLAVAATAAAEVLKWARRQAGTQLPKAFWDGESFDLPLPGRDPSAIRLRTDGADLWAFRMHRPDSNVPGRAWTTEVVLGHSPGRTVRFSARLLVASDEPELAIAPAVQGFVRQVATKCGLIVGGQSAAPDPLVFRTREDAEELIDHLLDPARVLPTFVLTAFDGAHAPPIDAAALNGHILGLAHVVVAHADACWLLTERLGKRLSVFGGAARVYLPGFDEASDPFAHRLVLGGTLASREGAERTARWLREMAAQASLHRTRLGKDVLTFAELRASSFELRQAALGDTASESEQLATALQQIRALQEQIESIRAENEYYIGEWDKERERAEAAETQAQASAWRIQSLTDKLREGGDDPDSGATFPAAWGEFVAWVERLFAGRLVLTNAARRGVRKPVFNDVQTAARRLLWLAKEGRERFIKGGGSLSNVTIMDGIQNAPCGDDAYEFDWSGRKLSAEWHIKSGGNTHDPVRCLRIYYCFDEQTQQIIVSDMPAHRRTGAT